MDTPPSPPPPPTPRPTSTPLETARRLLADRLAGVPAWLLVTQLFIGFGWLRAAIEKVIDPAWWRGAVVAEFVASHRSVAVDWYQPFLDIVVAPTAGLVSLTVVAAQLVAASSLITGRRLGLGLGIGAVLNLNFLASGAIDPSVFYLLAQGSVALWLAERNPTPEIIGRLRLAATLATFVACLSLPFVSTLDPAAVIDDPAAMLAFGGALASGACLLVLARGTMVAEVVANHRAARERDPAPVGVPAPGAR